MSSPSISYQPSQSTCQVNSMSTYPTSYQLNPPTYQIHTTSSYPTPFHVNAISSYPTSSYTNHQAYQWSPQQDYQAPLIDLSSPMQQDLISFDTHDTFDKEDTNLEWPPPSTQMLIHEPTTM